MFHPRQGGSPFHRKPAAHTVSPAYPCGGTLLNRRRQVGRDPKLRRICASAIYTSPRSADHHLLPTDGTRRGEPRYWPLSFSPGVVARARVRRIANSRNNGKAAAATYEA